MSSSKGVLFLRNVNGEPKWFEDDDEDNDGKYFGEIENGVPDGQGTFSWSNGDKYVGEWKDGKPWDGPVYDKNGKIIFKYVNGVLQK